MTRKRLTRQQKNEQFIVDVINKMFEIAGHNVTFDDIKDRKDDWYTQWTMTMAQNKEWEEWGISEIKKRFRYNKKLAKREMSMVTLMWGLKYSDWENNNNVI
jgi:predicted ArsR family transcriptional regulator